MFSKAISQTNIQEIAVEQEYAIVAVEQEAIFLLTITWGNTHLAHSESKS